MNQQKTKYNFAQPQSTLTEKDKKESQLFYSKCKTEPLNEILNLLDKGAFPNHMDESTGEYPIHVLIKRVDITVDFLKKLFERTHKYEININAKTNKTGETVLHLACSLGKPEITECLLDKGANPNIQDNNGNTCLHLIMTRQQNQSEEQTQNEEMLQRCLEYGANVEISDNQNIQINQMTSNVEFTRRIMEQKMDSIETVVGGDVEIAFSWKNLNDLDLHCQCCCGNEICFSRKLCNTCHGFLDHDMNVSISSDPKQSSNTPVEHIYWPTVVPGTYTVYANYYRNHQGIQKNSEYLVVMSIKGDSVFTGSGVLTEQKDKQKVFSFSFDKEGTFSVVK